MGEPSTSLSYKTILFVVLYRKRTWILGGQNRINQQSRSWPCLGGLHLAHQGRPWPHGGRLLPPEPQGLPRLKTTQGQSRATRAMRQGVMQSDEFSLEVDGG